ncbi:hypothetical protein BKA62DRAFT_758822 [Auriculariales sp. MPI-PUGE-AT-0066]|nr:hypothetical protein BKA62DRAFT_758822 [Auriculariales sp. MPI-PUGE-AT-0066]
MVINPLQNFPYDIRHQIVDEIGARDPAQLYPLLNVDKFSRSLVRDHPAWYGHLVLEHTGASALGIFNSQLVACKEHKLPTDLEVQLGARHDTELQKEVFIKIMAILPFTKSIRLKLRLADPRPPWKKFAKLPALRLESLHINLMNLQGISEQLVLPAHLFSGQAPLLKDIDALFDYRSSAVTPFTGVESVCWKLSRRKAAGRFTHHAASTFSGGNIVAHYPSLRKLVFHGDEYPGLQDLFTEAPGRWQLEDVEIWGVSSHQGEPLTFKALICAEKYGGCFVLSLSTESSKTVELRDESIPGVSFWVHRTLTKTFAFNLSNITKLEFDLQLWNQVAKSGVSFSAVHAVVLHVTDKPFWEMLDLEPDVDRLNDSGFFALDQCVDTPRITCLKIIGNATPRVPVEETWIKKLIATRMSGFDPTASPVVIQRLKVMTPDGTLNGFSGWSQLTIEDCDVLLSD